MIRIISGLMMCPLLATAAAASDGPAAPKAAAIIDEIASCRAISADAARLACFDRTAAALVTARADKQIVVIDREDVKKTKRSLFGFSLPKINLFGGGKNGEDDTPEIQTVDATIKGVRSIPNGLFAVTLDDDSQWQFTEPMTFPPKAGDPVHIKRGALGAYFGSVKGRVGVKIKRIG